MSGQLPRRRLADKPPAEKIFKPRKPANLKKSVKFTIALTAAQHEHVCEMASKSQLTPAEWARAKLSEGMTR